EAARAAEAVNPAPAPRRTTGRQLGLTGATNRSLLLLAGVALLLGALAVAFGDGPLRVVPIGGTARHRRRPAGWESGVPLAPDRREAVRRRMQEQRRRP
ncbi:MAG TPA: hypothetical protein VI854_02360, partial [Acidimicrobiia bacterium]|nr:hypothetical protein [Acidimicrobiia bacterium]